MRNISRKMLVFAAANPIVPRTHFFNMSHVPRLPMSTRAQFPRFPKDPRVHKSTMFWVPVSHKSTRSQVPRRFQGSTGVSQDPLFGPPLVPRPGHQAPPGSSQGPLYGPLLVPRPGPQAHPDLQPQAHPGLHHGSQIDVSSDPANLRRSKWFQAKKNL